MDTRNFFKFINAIYNGRHRTIKALCNNDISVEQWKRIIAYKRKKFEECTFTCYINSQEFREKVNIFHNKFKCTLEDYEQNYRFGIAFDINTDKWKYFSQKYHTIRKEEITLACKFLDELLNNKTTNLTNHKTLDESFHYNLDYNEKQFNYVYDFLINGKFLNTNTTLEDFIYYFSGKGNKAQNGLKWEGSKVNLALFINELCNTEGKKWEKAQNIFGVSGLSQSCNNTNYRKSDNNPFEKLTAQLKDIK